MTTTSADQIICQTRCWIEKVIIGLNFCPFAYKVFEEETIHYKVIEKSDLAACLYAVADEWISLDKNFEFETSLLIFPKSFQEFEDFLEFVEMANTLLVDRGYQGIYQLAHFHPDYQFAGSDDNDPSNFTNRSPWPMLHVIRESSLEQALKSYPEPEAIPDRNIKLAREKGFEHMQNLLNACYKPGK